MMKPAGILSLPWRQHPPLPFLLYRENTHFASSPALFTNALTSSRVFPLTFLRTSWHHVSIIQPDNKKEKTQT